MSSSSQTPESWISAFCSLVGHEYFAEVSEDFIEDDFNLTGLQSQVPMYKEALEMILDVEPEEASDEEDEEEEEEEEDEDEDEDEDEMQDHGDAMGRGGYRRAADAAAAAAQRRHLRMASDLSIIESSAEMLYGLIHQRFITSRAGIQQMAEKYEMGHFGHCPRVYCQGTKVLPVGCSDIPGLETVKLFCPSCLDVYSPPNSRFQTVDGAFFGTTFGCLFFMTFPEIDTGAQIPPNLPNDASSVRSSPRIINPDKTGRASLSSSLTSQQPGMPLASLDNGDDGVDGNRNDNNNINQSNNTTTALPLQPEMINGVAPRNLAPGLGPGHMYEPRIYGFRVSEFAKTGPRMKWLRSRPLDMNELDECRIWAQTQEAIMKDDPTAATAIIVGTSTAGPTASTATAIADRPDAEMADANVEIDEGEMEDHDMDGAQHHPSSTNHDFDADSSQIHDVTQRRKPSNAGTSTTSGRTKRLAQDPSAGALVNGDSRGNAVRVGEAG